MTSLSIQSLDSDEKKSSSKITTCEELLVACSDISFKMYEKDYSESIKMLFHSKMASRFMTAFKVGKEQIIVYGSPIHMIAHSGLIKSILTISKVCETREEPIPIATHFEITKWPEHFVSLWAAINGFFQCTCPKYKRSVEEIDEILFIRDLFKYFDTDGYEKYFTRTLKTIISSWTEITEEKEALLERVLQWGKELELQKDKINAKYISRIIMSLEEKFSQDKFESLSYTYPGITKGRSLYRRNTKGDWVEFGKVVRDVYRSVSDERQIYYSNGKVLESIIINNESENKYRISKS
jgi:hypothetical protein